MDMPINDNDAVHGVVLEPDAHGQAALLLAESLIHSLIARSVISVEDAVEIVTVAVDAAEEIAGDLGNAPVTLQKSPTILKAIGQSLSHDL